MKKKNALLKITSLLTLSTTAVFATLYSVEYVKNDSQNPPRPTAERIYCDSFTCKNFITEKKDSVVVTDEHKFEFQNLATKSGEKIEMNADNFGLMAVLESDDTSIGIITSGLIQYDVGHTWDNLPDFSVTLNPPDASGIQILEFNYHLHLTTWMGSKELPAFALPTPITFYLLYFTKQEKRYDNFEFVYAKNDEKISSTFNCIDRCIVSNIVLSSSQKI